jgi:hypothetical protein
LQKTIARVNRRGCAYTAPEPKFSGKDHPFFLYPTISELIDIFRYVQAGRPIDLRTPTTHKTRASTRMPNTPARNEPNSHHRGDRGEDTHAPHLPPQQLVPFRLLHPLPRAAHSPLPRPRAHRHLPAPARRTLARGEISLSLSLLPSLRGSEDETLRNAAAGRDARLSVARLAATEQLAARSRGRCGVALWLSLTNDGCLWVASRGGRELVIKRTRGSSRPPTRPVRATCAGSSAGSASTWWSARRVRIGWLAVRVCKQSV